MITLTYLPDIAAYKLQYNRQSLILQSIPMSPAPPYTFINLLFRAGWTVTGCEKLRAVWAQLQEVLSQPRKGV